MTETVIYSTFFLTLLLMVGLFFFIRASTKDRIESLILAPQGSTEATLKALTTYLEGRAYRVQRVNAEDATLQFSGFVRPSWFLAGFLTVLAAVGCLCFALVLAIMFPTVGNGFTGLVILSPVAGWFYWQRSGREEQVVVRVAPATTPEDNSPSPAAEAVTPEPAETLVVTAHRDELAALQQAWANGLGQVTVAQPS